MAGVTRRPVSVNGRWTLDYPRLLTLKEATLVFLVPFPFIQRMTAGARLNVLMCSGHCVLEYLNNGLSMELSVDVA